MNHIWKEMIGEYEGQEDKFCVEHKEIKIEGTFVMHVDKSITSIRICQTCGQESVNLEEPELSCEESKVKEILEG